MVFVACGCVCLARAHAIAGERTAWALIAVGLLVYASGSVVYNLDLASAATVPFPSRADTLWLGLYPLCFAGMVALVRARHVQVNASLWLDALIGGSAVAAIAAVFVLSPVVEVAAGAGPATTARVAYPLFDLVLTGFAVVLWGAGRWRLDAWCALAAGFALIAVGDSAYVVAQTGEGWDPGSLTDLAYAAGTMLLAVAAWRSEPRRRDVPNARVALPIAFTVTSFALVSYEAIADLDVLAVVLIRLTLLAVVLRLGVTLWWLSRQRADLEALAASDPLTGLGNYRAFQEQLAAAVADGAQASVIVLDLDHFKALNDTYGHGEGDRVLQATATALQRTAGDPAFVARVGGEEFAILIPQVDAARGGRGRGGVPRRARPARDARPGAGLLGRGWRPSPPTRRPCSSCSRRRTARCTGPSARAATGSGSTTRVTSSRCRCTSSGARSRACSRPRTPSRPPSSR